MAAKGSSEPNLLRVTLEQHPTFEENQGRSEVRKRALAPDYSKSYHTSVKKSKLSPYDDADDPWDSLERDIEEYCTIGLQNKKKKVDCILKIDEVYKKMQKKIDDCVCDFVNNETLCGLMQDLIRERELQLKNKEEELDAIKKLIDGQARGLVSERKKLDKEISTKNVQMKECESMKKRLEGRIQELESIEKKLEGRVKEFNLKEEEFKRREKEAELKFRSQAKDIESKKKQLEGQVKEFELKKQKFESQVKEHELKERREKQSIKEENESDETESLLKTTSDPSKVVLDIMQNPIVPLLKNEDDAGTMYSHISLLEKLLSIAPRIKPCVRGEAIKLAFDLRGNMRTSSQNSLKVLRFLLLLSIYGLVPFFDEDEVSKLFEFADKSSDFVQNLVKKQQHIEAVRFICAFKLADKNQPVDLLWKYVESAKLVSESSCKNTTSVEIQEKARDQEIATLTNVLLCISDNNLEPEDLLNEIQDRIVELNMRKCSNVCDGTWASLQMCNNLRKRNVGLKPGGRMEPGDAETGDKVLDFNNEEPGKGEGCDGDENVNEEVGREAYGVEQNEEKSSDRTPHCPFRPDAEDCVFYMKTGSCKYGSSCWFNHSIKEKAGEATERSSLIVCKKYQKYGGCKYGNSCWFVHTRGNSSERSMNNPATETNVDTRCQKQMSVEEEFPERPGEPECRNYLRTGNCIFKSDCKFHHPRLPTCNLSDKGLPPRPDQNVCSHYSCKFEPDCKHDRPHGL